MDVAPVEANDLRPVGIATPPGGVLADRGGTCLKNLKTNLM